MFRFWRREKVVYASPGYRKKMRHQKIKKVHQFSSFLSFLILACLFFFAFATKADEKLISGFGKLVGIKDNLPVNSVSAPKFKPGEIIVKYKPEAAVKIEAKLGSGLKVGLKSFDRLVEKQTLETVAPVFKQVRSQVGAQALDNLKPIYKIKLKGEFSLYQELEELKKDPDVLWAEPNYLASVDVLVPNDPLYSQQWGLARIKAPEAWGSLQAQSETASLLDQLYTAGTQKINLTDNYADQTSQTFTPGLTGRLDKIEVELGAWGMGTYPVLAKITDARGQIIDSEVSVRVGPSGQRTGWISFAFTGRPQLNQGQAYKLYLKQSISWSAFFWKASDNVSKNYKVYLSPFAGEVSLTQTIVAVVDTGIDYNHEDLQGKVILGKNFVDPENVTDDVMDVYGHGTHIAGIIAASTNNALGIAGITKENLNPKIRILAVKGLGDKNYGSFESLTLSLIYAAQNNAKVINASWGAGIFSQLMKDTVVTIKQNYDCQIVASAGNSMTDLDSNPNNPGGYKEVITVGASDQQDNLSVWRDGESGSNYGYKMDLVAPGTAIFSSIPGGKYESWNGTSMAAPHVSAAYAFLKALHPNWTKDQVRQIIELTADDLGETGKDKIFGFGRLNLEKALRVANPDQLPQAKISFPANGEVVFGGKTTIHGWTNGPNFREYKISYKKDNSSDAWKTVYQSSQPVANEADLGSVIDLSSVQGEWVIVKMEVYLNNAVVNYNADTIRLFINNTQGWSVQFAPTSLTSPAIGDLNNDGYAEIITTGGNSSYIEKEKIHLFDYQGNYLPGWPLTTESFVRGGQPRIIDNPKGGKLVLINGSREILLLNEKGESMPGWPIENLQATGEPAVGDINADGKQEMVFINKPDYTHDPRYYEIKAVSLEGLAGWTNTITDLLYPSNPVMADVNSDGYQEIIFNGLDRQYQTAAYVLNHKGEVLNGWPIVKSDPIHTSDFQPLVINWDNDNDYEILIALEQSAYVYDVKQGGPREIVSWNTVGTQGRFVAPPLVADIDGNGTQEIIFQTVSDSGQFTSEIQIFDNFKKAVETIHLPENEHFKMESEHDGGITPVDLDEDGQLELIVLSVVENIVGDNFTYYDKLEVYDLFPEPKKVYETFLPGEVMHSAVIVGDVNNNGRMEMLVNTWDGKLNVFEFPQSYQAGANKCPWPMFNHDPQNTRNYNFRPPTGLVVPSITPTTALLTATPTPTPSPTPTSLPTPTASPTPIPTAAPSPVPVQTVLTWNSSADYSSVQGQRNWYYQYFDGQNYRDLSFERSFWGVTAWHIPATTDQWCEVSGVGQHPCASESVRKWVSPKTGRLVVTGNVRKNDINSSGDGVRFSIWRGNQKIYERDLAYNDNSGVNLDLNLGQVQPGEAIYFRLHRRASESHDSTFTDFNLKLTSNY